MYGERILTNFRNSYGKGIELKMGFKGCHGLKVGEFENKSTANGYDFIFRVRDRSFGARVSAGSYLNKKIKGTLSRFAHIIRQKINSKGQEQGMTLKEIFRFVDSPPLFLKLWRWYQNAAEDLSWSSHILSRKAYEIRRSGRVEYCFK